MTKKVSTETKKPKKLDEVRADSTYGVGMFQITKIKIKEASFIFKLVS